MSKFKLESIPSASEIRLKLKPIIGAIADEIAASSTGKLTQTNPQLNQLINELCDPFNDKYHRVRVILDVREQLFTLLEEANSGVYSSADDDSSSTEDGADIFDHGSATLSQDGLDAAQSDDDRDWLAQSDDSERDSADDEIEALVGLSPSYMFFANNAQQAPAQEQEPAQEQAQTAQPTAEEILLHNVKILTPQVRLLDLCMVTDELPGIIRVDYCEANPEDNTSTSRYEPAAYFKPGHLRQQYDHNFLFTYWQRLRAKLDLPETMADAMCPSMSCRIRLSQVDFGNKIDKQSHFLLDHRRGNELQEVRVNVKKNICDNESIMAGGIQPAIDEWQPKSATAHSDDFLAMLLMVTLLSGKDIKANGIGNQGSGTLFDFEDFLQRYKITRSASPSLE